jgi:acyl-CoA synthetase (NDP forming)
MAALARRHQKPIVAWVMGHGDAAQDIARELERRGIPVLDEIRKGLRVLAALTARR